MASNWKAMYTVTFSPRTMFPVVIFSLFVWSAHHVIDECCGIYLHRVNERHNIDLGQRKRAYHNHSRGEIEASSFKKDKTS